MRIGPSKQQHTFTICNKCKYLQRGGVSRCVHPEVKKVAIYTDGDMIGYLNLDNTIYLTPNWCPAK